MRTSGSLILATLLLLASAPGRGFADPLEPALEAAVTSLSGHLSDGVASYSGGEAAYGTKGAFEHRIVVLFGLSSWGGGNGSRQFLAVFERHDELPAHFQLIAVAQVGNDFDRWFKSIRLDQDRIVVVGGKWSKSDAHCCPSGTVRVVYRLGRSGLSESAP